MLATAAAIASENDLLQDHAGAANLGIQSSQKISGSSSNFRSTSNGFSPEASPPGVSLVKGFLQLWLNRNEPQLAFLEYKIVRYR